MGERIKWGEKIACKKYTQNPDRRDKFTSCKHTFMLFCSIPIVSSLIQAESHLDPLPCPQIHRMSFKKLKSYLVIHSFGTHQQFPDIRNVICKVFPMLEG